jgi:intracellular sulfur oxidation DsrE/DsrF family protein
MIRISALLCSLLLAMSVMAGAPAMAQDKVVYHIDEATVQGLRALRTLRNHLDVAPATKITVVTYADGVDLLLEGARDPKSKTEYAALVSALKSNGVGFEVCEITMKRRGLTKEQFVLDADFVPSGVVRITELQAREHYAYVKP